MTGIYDEAIQSKSAGDCALQRGDARSALEHYRSAYRSLRQLSASADPRLREVIDKGNTILERDIKRIQSTLEQSKSMKNSKIKTDRKQRAPKIGHVETDTDEKNPTDCAEMGFDGQIPRNNFMDFVGMNDVKEGLRRSIELPLSEPEEYKRLGISTKVGIILYGPPGCGKTFLVRCAAGEFSIPIYAARADSLSNFYVGETEKNVSRIFHCARSAAPSILFVDEIDSLLSKDKRGGSSDVYRRVEGLFLQELDGVDDERQAQVIFVAATNRPWNLDPALIRPGRINMIIYMPPPDDRARFELFRLLLPIEITRGIDYKENSRLTAPKDGYYYSSSGIREICEIAKLEAVNEKAEKAMKKVTIEARHISVGLRAVPRSVTPDMLHRFERFRETYLGYVEG